MTKTKSIIAVAAAMITVFSAAELGHAQYYFPPPPVKFNPFGFGRSVVKGVTGVGRGVTGIGKAIARPIGKIGSATVRGAGKVGYGTMRIAGRRYFYYSQLPIGYRPVLVGTQRYYVYDNVYYSPYTYRGSIVYIVVPRPF